MSELNRCFYFFEIIMLSVNKHHDILKTEFKCTFYSVFRSVLSVDSINIFFIWFLCFVYFDFATLITTTFIIFIAWWISFGLRWTVCVYFRLICFAFTFEFRFYLTFIFIFVENVNVTIVWIWVRCCFIQFLFFRCLIVIFVVRWWCSFAKNCFFWMKFVIYLGCVDIRFFRFYKLIF